MKKVAAVVLGLGLLAGCSSQQGEWVDNRPVEFAGTSLSLESNLWFNKMPTIGEVQDKTLHGAVYLEAEETLPADLEIESVTLRQGDEVVLIEGDLLELRTHSEHKWEVAFVWQLELEESQPVDVALTLNDGQSSQIIVEQDVKIDSVY
ncbi:hypothetical protein [Vibrio sonorensis]|uniref:hypothetical protein n=1 Tax=Vibrio sonorensis TaxID=1004316 RepID=UPI0008D99D60|nr:hypothetical protein [Vibrio sonorensis]